MLRAEETAAEEVNRLAKETADRLNVLIEECTSEEEIFEKLCLLVYEIRLGSVQEMYPPTTFLSYFVAEYTLENVLTDKLGKTLLDKVFHFKDKLAALRLIQQLFALKSKPKSERDKKDEESEKVAIADSFTRALINFNVIAYVVVPHMRQLIQLVKNKELKGVNFSEYLLPIVDSFKSREELVLPREIKYCGTYIKPLVFALVQQKVKEAVTTEDKIKLLKQVLDENTPINQILEYQEKREETRETYSPNIFGSAQKEDFHAGLDAFDPGASLLDRSLPELMMRFNALNPLEKQRTGSPRLPRSKDRANRQF